METGLIARVVQREESARATRTARSDEGGGEDGFAEHAYACRMDFIRCEKASDRERRRPLMTSFPFLEHIVRFGK